MLQVTRAEYLAAQHVIRNVNQMTNREHCMEYMDDVEKESYLRSIEIVKQYKEQLVRAKVK
jgi:hypothetical protein